MSNNYFITNLLNIKDKNLNFSNGIYHKVIKGVTYTILTAKLEYSEQVCSNCGSNHNLIKYGFKSSIVRCSRAGEHPVLIDLKKQKMYCKDCNKYFLLESKIVDKHCNISNQVKKHIFADLTKKISIKDIARDNSISTTSVARFLARFDNYFNVDFRTLPKHLCFDEFKSTKDAKGAMSFIYCDADNHKIVDIVENRQLPFLKRYFSSFPKSVRNQVETICIDMHSPYISLIKELFVNAKIIIDRLHIVGLFSRSFNQIRVDTMKTFSTYSSDYKKLKKYWKLFLKPYRLLSSTVLSKKIHFSGRYISQLDVVNESISIDKVLEDSYTCYQIIRQDIENRDFESFKKHLIYFRDRVGFRMQVSIDTCLEYIDYLKNSFNFEYSNGAIEDINNYIKVLKRVAFGYRNFANFRTRILISRNLFAS
ncbi:ISL3 family transposase [Anaerococcus sp. Marseille-P3625]|uniref:ISL3 family transposase n=1 Tax=Anaerococcus sp. Marseille-P3625 TaxID=1977277 RepID=UPI000C0776B1|nr:ISL3 family transposase [Anaerococcus sp. Marseille-P3625]